MSNNKKSTGASIAVCYIVLIGIALFSITVPCVILAEKSNGVALRQAVLNLFLISCYPCSALGIATLILLIKMLKRIKASNPFCVENVRALRLISYFCFAVAVITLGAGISSYVLGDFYIPFFFVSIPAAFFGLILRVVKNVMQSALEIREENDLTV